METVREEETPEFTVASVFIDGRETTYLRAGAGLPVLILIEDDTARSVLARTLLPGARVILPERTSGDTVDGGAMRIRGLLDGLGLDRCAIIADRTAAARALASTVTEPDRITHLAVLVDAGHDFTTGTCIEDQFASTAQSILVISRDSGHDWPHRIAHWLGA